MNIFAIYTVELLLRILVSEIDKFEMEILGIKFRPTDSEFG